MPIASRGPLNLTSAAERVPWSDTRELVRILGRTDGTVLELVAVDDSLHETRSPTAFDEIYVIISGYGLLHCGDHSVECTAGDVLLAPGGVEHRFQRLNGSIKAWRISLQPTTARKESRSP